MFVAEDSLKRQRFLLSRELCVADLALMNVDNEGEVSRLEYIEYMLRVMKKVDQSLLNDIHASFDKLDVDKSGTLQRVDIELAARRKLGTQRKFLLFKLKPVVKIETEVEKGEKIDRTLNLAASKFKSKLKKEGGAKVAAADS